MTDDKLTQELINMGVTFPEGKVPTKWHHCWRGDEPRTILCYERQVWHCVDARVKLKGSWYSEIFCFDHIGKMRQGNISITEWSFCSLIVTTQRQTGKPQTEGTKHDKTNE